ncbi:MAG TPA: ribosome biogenesis GTPase YlqF [Candidatus Atribacteria bacterium]|nr:ribosome biogenesis GTPase YlqF [Candidatus Atribacteria bacterium]
MNINWYPGHMAKAKQMMQESLKLVDMVIELLDARAPSSSSNPDFNALYAGKVRYVVLNKSDYADKTKTETWLNHFEKQNIKAIAANALNNTDIKRVRDLLFDLAKAKQLEIKQRKGINKTIRAMVVGIPNVGKSTFINSIAGAAKAKTGDKPGVTKARQWVRITPYFELLDTPGMLWPRLDNARTGLHLAYIGSIKEEIIDIEEVAAHFLEDMTCLYPRHLSERYKLEDLNQDGHKLLEAIAAKRGMLKPGMVPDTERCARVILNEYQAGLLGATTLELPDNDL